MKTSEISGVTVPSAILPLFNKTISAIGQRVTPFSYSKPIPDGPKLHKRIHCPRVIPRSFWSSFEEEEELEEEQKMPQTVHLQYNSPMGLYSKEAATQQFEQQIGASPNDLPAPDKHFDPSKSATLKYIKEGENENFGENFFEKVAQAEAPKVPYQPEPNWTRTAREKSERARSKTPADPFFRPAGSPAPSNHPVHHETAREHAEKNRIFTHNINEPWGRPYYEASEGLQRNRRSHSTGPIGRDYPNRGYELGGIDYTQGVHIDHGTDYQYYEEPQRKSQPPKLPPGYELGGTDFYKGHVPGNSNYRGHGPDPPRLRPKYTADTHDPCNVVVAPNLEEVNANLLIGDTLSNQKIRHEVRNIDQSTFGTSFGPTSGFKRDHQTVYRAAEPPKPVVYSLSANKNLARSQSVPRSSAPPEQHNVWNVSQQETDKEVSIRTLLNDEALRAPKREQSPYWADHSEQKHQAWQGKVDPTLQRYETYITEPNWRRNVDQRRLAWERRAFENEQRLSRPYSERVAPGVPPAWHAEAQHKHQQWQQQADNMNSNQSYNYSSYQSQPQQQQQSFYDSRNQTTNTSTGPIYNQLPSHQQNFEHSNAERLLNTGYNTNQVDYVLSHKNNYNEGPHYQPPIVNSSAAAQNNASSNQYSSTFNRSSSNVVSNQAIPLGAPQNTTSSYNTETRITGNAPGYQNSGLNSQQQNYHTSSYNTTSTKTIPVQHQYSNSLQSKHEESHSERHEERSQSVPAVISSSFQEDERSERSYATSGAIPLPAPDNYEGSNYNKSYSSHTTTTTQQQNQPVAVPAPQNYSNSYHTETHSSTGPIVHHSPGGQSYRSTDFSSSRYNKQETTTTTTTSQPSFQTTALPVTRSTTYNYHTRDVPSQPSRPSFQQDSFTTHSEKHSSTSAPRPQPASYQYENYLSSRKEESRPVSQLSQYSESRNYKRNFEEKTETTTIPAVAPATNVTYKDLSNAQSVDDVFNKKTEMNESLPIGSLSNTHNNTEGGYRDASGHDVSYKRETQTSADPGRETALLKEEEKRVVETPLEPGVISRHVTTKYYKKKTVTDTTTTTA